MDNKPMELEALNAIQNNISVLGFRYANPNYDENGGDFFIIKEVGEGEMKAIRCQSKGRNLSAGSSNVHIPEKYVTKFFVLFVYLRDDDRRQTYMFVADDIVQWNYKDGIYTKTFTKSYLETEEKHLFDKTKIAILTKMLDEISMGVSIEIFDAMETLSSFYTLWRKSGSMPDRAALDYWQEQYDGNYISLPEMLFLIIALAHADKEDVGHSIDPYFFKLKDFGNLCQVEKRYINFGDSAFLNSCLTYNHTYISPASYNNGSEQIDGWHLHFGDSEEYFNIEIFRNRKYNIEYSNKYE